MKGTRLAGTCLALALLLCLLPTLPGHDRDGGAGNADFESFRQARLLLPQKEGLFCPLAAGDFLLAYGGRYLCPGPNQFHVYRLAQSYSYDLDGDGREEKYTLADGRLKVTTASRLLWESAPDWWVDYFFIGDANNDSTPELNLSVWKEGSFGPHRPFWLADDDREVKNHLFIFKLEAGEIRPVWQSSRLDRPNYRTALLDYNGDGANELVALEGCYDDREKLQLTVWKWNGWGFSRIIK